MSKFEDSLICDGCGAEIRWSPITWLGQNYCCEDCRYGLRCDCAARQEPDEEGYSTISSASAGEQLF